LDVLHSFRFVHFVLAPAMTAAREEERSESVAKLSGSTLRYFAVEIDVAGTDRPHPLHLRRASFGRWIEVNGEVLTPVIPEIRMNSLKSFVRTLESRRHSSSPHGIVSSISSVRMPPARANKNVLAAALEDRPSRPARSRITQHPPELSPFARPRASRSLMRSHNRYSGFWSRREES